jgi:hypothetical protein
MTHSDNFREVIEAIEAERGKNPSSGLIELRQTKENKLNTIPISDIQNILFDLELGPAHRIIKIVKENSPDDKEEDVEFQLWDPLEVVKMHFNSGTSYTIEILDTYPAWFSNYTQEIKLQDLTYPNLIKIYEVILVIYEKTQLAASSEIDIDLGYATTIAELKDIEKYGDPKKYRLDVLDYLKKENIISDYQLSEYKISGANRNDSGTKAKITINREKFNSFFKITRSNYKQRPKEKLTRVEPPSPKEPPSPQTKSSKPALNLPSDTKWEDITIKFVDGHNINIKCKDKISHSDYKEMGFEDSKSRRPNKQWALLQQLAENHGEISWERSATGKNPSINKTTQYFGYEFDDESNAPQNKGFLIIKAPDKLKKTKQLLAQALKAYFKIDEDPFFPYDKVKAYKIKIRLIA